jgi:hypothetical protein
LVEDPILYILLRVYGSVVLCHIWMFHINNFEDFYLVIELLFGELFGSGLYDYVIGVMQGVDASF